MGRLTVQTVAIDSNIFIYVLEDNPEFCKISLAILQQIEAGNLRGLSSQLTYLESLSFTQLTVQQAETTEAFLTNSGADFKPVSLDVLQEAARLRRSMPSLKTPDAIHIATATLHGADIFVTNDLQLTKLKEVDGVKIVALKEFKL